MTNKKFLLIPLVSFLSPNVYAEQPQDDHEEEQNSFMMGIFVGKDKSIYVGGEDKTRVNPYLSGEWGNIYLQGPALGYKLYDQGDLTISTEIELDGIFNDDRDNSAELSDMTSLDSVFMVGVNTSYETDYGEFEWSVKADVSNSHDGFKSQLSYSYPFFVSGWRVSPELSVEWASEEINQYYYGVSAADVRENRPFYEAKSGINYEVGISAMYPFKKRHAIMLRAGYQKFSSEITDSPIVDEKSTTEFGLGYIYRF